MITKVLVTVMTYPTLSEKYFETVCTAGFREDGSWIRIFPVPHRLLREQYDTEAYAKWQWIEADLERNDNHDDRPESYHIANIDTLRVLQRIDIKGKPNWDLRQHWVHQNKPIFSNMSDLIQRTKKNELSLAVLKPTKILDMTCEPVDMEKFSEKLKKLQIKYDAQKNNIFFDKTTLDYNFSFAEKIPYKFRYHFLTEDGQERKIMVEDWEIGQLFRNCLKTSQDVEQAKQKVVDKYMHMATTKNLYFFMGTSYQWQKRKAPDPYLIIGVFCPPKSRNLLIDFEK